MLTLTRAVGESVRIGTAVVTVLEHKNGAAGREVRLGIEAPRDVEIARTEIDRHPLERRIGSAGRGISP